MRRSSVLARVLTSILALILVPTALVLLSVGGQEIAMRRFAYGSGALDLTTVAGPLLLQAVAVLLLMLVVLTGIWSSAGLILAGALGLIALVLSMIPAALASLSRVIPYEWGDGMIYGVPLTVLPVLGAMGLALSLVRRRPEPKSAALGITGILLAPLLLTGGAYLIVWSVGRGVLPAFRLLEYELHPDAMLAMIGGVILVMLGVAIAHWSPFALILPALALFVLSILTFVSVPTVFDMLVSLPHELLMVLPLLVLFGAAAASAMLYLTFTAVLLRVRSQARLIHPTNGAGFTGSTYPQQPQQGYPPQPGYTPPPASYFPPSGVGPAMHQPAIPPYPPQPGS